MDSVEEKRTLKAVGHEKSGGREARANQIYTFTYETNMRCNQGHI
jgi:hypothetical protein